MQFGALGQVWSNERPGDVAHADPGDPGRADEGAGLRRTPRAAAPPARRAAGTGCAHDRGGALPAQDAVPGPAAGHKAQVGALGHPHSQEISRAPLRETLHELREASRAKLSRLPAVPRMDCLRCLFA